VYEPFNLILYLPKYFSAAHRVKLGNSLLYTSLNSGIKTLNRSGAVISPLEQVITPICIIAVAETQER